eukprot:5869141-Pyramimonas_sp.AAC.1
MARSCKRSEVPSSDLRNRVRRLKVQLKLALLGAWGDGSARAGGRARSLGRWKSRGVPGSAGWSPQAVSHSRTRNCAAWAADRRRRKALGKW